MKQAIFSGKKRWLIGGALLLLLLIFVFLVEVDKLIELFQAIHWASILGAAALLLVGYLLITVRLRYILFNRVGWWETFYANSIGYMLHISLFVPAMVGRAVSTGWITNATMPQASSAILVERLFAQVMRLLAAALAIVLLSSQQTNPTTSVGASIILLLLVFVLIVWVVNHPDKVVNGLASRLSRFPRFDEGQIRSTTTSMLQGLEAVSSTPRLLMGMALSIAAWSCFLIFQYLVLLALPLELPVNQMWLIAVAVLTVMPPSINVMLIVYQVVVVILLVTLNLMDTTSAIVYAITLHLIQMICWLILGNWSLHKTNLKFSQLVEAVKQYAGSKDSDPQQSET